MKKNIILFTAFLICLNLHAQSKKVTIRVLDKNNNPLSGAIILFDDVRQKRWTNSKGFFKAKFKKAPKEISAFHPKIGIKKIKYNGANTVFIIIKKGENLYAKYNSNRNQFYNIYDYLRGKFPGVNIASDNTITIRGFNTVNGSTTPLFILNGLSIGQEAFSIISPSEIKSIKVLKGPDTAVYGVRGANGVIVVKTM